MNRRDALFGAGLLAVVVGVGGVAGVWWSLIVGGVIACAVALAMAAERALPK